MGSTSAQTICPSKLDRLRSQAKGYVINNLEMYGNSLLPDDLIKLLGIPTTERLLTVIMGEQVSIYRMGKSWVAQR